MKKRIAVFCSGSGSNLQSILDREEEINGRVVLVLSSSANAYALQRAKDHKIDTAVLARGENDFTEKMLSLLEKYRIDLIVLAGYLSILPSEIVVRYENAILNIHPSLIPAFCGKGFYGIKVARAMLERGVKIAGATVHFVDEGADTGPIVMQKTVAVQEDDTPEMLQQRVLHEAEHKILPEAVKLFCDGKLIVEKGRVRIRT